MEREDARVARRMLQNYRDFVTRLRAMCALADHTPG
jgi:hypothetical protein